MNLQNFVTKCDISRLVMYHKPRIPIPSSLIFIHLFSKDIQWETCTHYHYKESKKKDFWCRSHNRSCRYRRIRQQLWEATKVNQSTKFEINIKLPGLNIEYRRLIVSAGPFPTQTPSTHSVELTLSSLLMKLLDLRLLSGVPGPASCVLATPWRLIGAAPHQSNKSANTDQPENI